MSKCMSESLSNFEEAIEKCVADGVNFDSKMYIIIIDF